MKRTARRSRNYLRNLIKIPTYFYDLVQHAVQMHEQVVELRYRVEAMDRAAAEFGSRVVEQERQLSAIREGLERLSGSTDGAQGAVERLQTLHEDAGKMQTSVDQINQSLSAVQPKFDVLKTSVDQINHTLAEAQPKLDQIRDFNAGLRDSSAHLSYLPDIADRLSAVLFNTNHLCKAVHAPENLHAQFEYIVGQHPDWLRNPLSAYQHDYTVGNPEAAPLDKTIIFIHLPKTGGSTLTHVIRRNVRSIAFRKDFLKQPNIMTGTILESFRALSPEDQERERTKWSQYDVLANHGRYGLHEMVDGPCDYITMLRHPIDRFISHYRYTRQLPSPEWKGGQTKADRAQQLSLLEFLTDPYFRALFIRDYSYAQIFAGTSGKTITRTVYEQALKNLQTFKAVLVMEQFDASMALLEKLYGWKDELLEDGQIVPRQNKIIGDITGSTGAHAELSDKERSTLTAFLRFDLELYEHARQMFGQQCEEQGIALETEQVVATRSEVPGA